jgi:pimeloyl-ACP methyl ester carboxylesterase/molybdopterin/thiamine biosynthesis adenylyltransferase
MVVDYETYDRSFSRNLGILTAEEQQRLAASTVAVAGLGGIGGNTVVTLARMGVGGFRLADFDRFEHVNINRQYGATVDTLGKGKCDVIATEVRRINPSARVTLFPEGFTEDNASAILDSADLAVDAIDFYAIETHLSFHRATRKHGLFTLMGSPVGFSACLQVFDPRGMSLEDYCGIQPDMTALEQQLRYACGLVPELAHIDYYDVSANGSNTDFLSGTGPSLACACGLAASLVATEAAILLLGRRPARAIPHTMQFDPYTFRYEQTFINGGMTSYDPGPVLERIADRSSLVAQVLRLLYEKPRAQRARINGAELYYSDEGRGEAVVLLSPLGSDASFWVRQVEDLSRQFRVITMDNRGSGASDRCPEGCSTALLADDVIGLLEHLGIDRAHLIGLALGGLIAQQVAMRRPDLVGSLVLASCYAAADERIEAVTSSWRTVAVEQGMQSLFETCRDWVFSPEYVEHGREELARLKTFFSLTMQDPLDFCRQSLAGVQHCPGDELQAIRCPVLVIHGGGDRIVDLQAARGLASKLRDARMVLIESAPHFLAWEHAGRFNSEVTTFLREIAG